MDYKTANRLIELRKQNSFSQDELAAKLGVSRQAISNWERAEALPTTENLIALGQLYKISLDELILGDKASPSQTTKKDSDKISPTQTDNMKPVKPALKLVSLIHVIIGSAFLLIGGILIGLAFIFAGDVLLALSITGGALAFSGLVELVIGIAFYAIVNKQKNRLEYLKTQGIKIQVDDISIKRVPGIHTVNLITIRLECTYTYQAKTNTILSPMFLTNRNNQNHIYDAYVYLNPLNLDEVAIEVLSQAK